MRHDRLTRQQMLGLLLTAILGALCLLALALTPRRQAPPDVYLPADSTATAPRQPRPKKPRATHQPAPPPRNHLDEQF